MLIKLDTLGRDLEETFKEIESWEEIKFHNQDKDILKNSIEDVSRVNESSIQLTFQNNLHSILPSQYILYAVLIKEFAVRLREYTDLIDKIRNTHGKDITWDAINQSNTSLQELSTLDQNSKELIFKPFLRQNCLMGAKDILNGDQSSRTLRSTKDFFTSVILKIVNVQDVSSSILGKVIYELAGNQANYNYLEKKFINNLPIIRSHKTISEFIRLTLTFIEKFGDLNNFLDLLVQNPDPKFLSIETQDKKLTSIFYQSSDLVTEDELSSSGKLRFISTPLFLYKNKFLYLSKEWTNTDEDLTSRLDFKVFKTIFEQLYQNFNVNFSNGKYELKANISNLNSDLSAESIIGSNKIFYGAPGTGKSHSIDIFTKDSKVIRTIFHPDTQYADFVGSIKPAFDGNDLTYEFRAGPFTTALVEALNHQTQHHYLIIEEINRAPAASVFGEVFQLLDRDPAGDSVYGINPSEPELIKYINSKITTPLHDNKIKIPKNLSLIATMNSSDQAVMPMDTAFKRRWNFEYVPLHFDNCPDGNFVLTYDVDGHSKNVSWKNFALVINQVLTNLDIPEDRHLGPYFLNDQDLKDSSSAQKALIGKLFIYLWDDVLRHGSRYEIFDSEIKTFGDLVKRFKGGFVVFSDSLLSELITTTDTQSQNINGLEI